MKKSSLAVMLLSLTLGCGSSAPRAFLEDAASQSAMQKASSSQQPNADPFPRKIIYTADIDLLVDNLSEVATKLDDLVKTHHGLLAQSEIASHPGAPRLGSWRV